MTDYGTAQYSELKQEKKAAEAATSTKFYFLIAIPLVVTILVGVILVYHHTDDSTPTPTPPFVDPPMTDQLRQQIRGLLNISADPCEDFYEFACGNWLNTFNLTGSAYDLSFNSIAAIVQKQYADTLTQKYQLTQDFQNACVNTSGTDSLGWQTNLLPWLNKIAAINTSADFLSVLGIMQSHGLAKYSIFHWQLQGDLANASESWFTFIPGGVTLSPSVYSNNTLTAQYINLVLQPYFQILQAANIITNAAVSASNVLVAEQWINNRLISVPSDSAVQVQQVVVETVASFEKMYNLPVSSYVKGFSAAGSSFNTLQFFGGNFYQNLSQELMVSNSTVFNPAAARDYLRWRLVFGVLDYLPQSFRSISNALYTNFGVRTPDDSGSLFFRVGVDGHKKNQYIVQRPAKKQSLGDGNLNQTQLCQDLLSNAFLNFYEQQWIIDYFPPENKAFAETLVSLIRSQLNLRLQNVDWLDEATRAAAIDKLNNIIANVAYDDSWIEYDLQFSGTNIFADYMTISIFNNNLTLSKADQPVDRNHFSNILALTVQNAYYDPNTNTINMLAGLMYPPFFAQTSPMMLNLAAYGMVIGHELTHGFDNNGRLFGPHGEFVNWWTPQSTANFNNLSSCLVHQYSGYNLSSGSVNGSNTLGENIADAGGINLAFKAYTNFMSTQDDQSPKLPGFTNDQLFFLYFAQSWCWKANLQGEAAILANVHSPPPFRVLGTLSDYPPFATAYSCSKNSVYGRSLTANRCEVW